MPDQRRHRGPHPRDATLFPPRKLPRLRRAAGDYSWLLDRGYTSSAALTLVGNRFQLQKRQREALLRAVCGRAKSRERRARRITPTGQALLLDGFNLIITVEAALAGGVVLRCEDGLHRDLAQVHSSYRPVTETDSAIALIGEALRPAASVLWLLDAPVSRSGDLAARIRRAGWEVELVPAVDCEIVHRNRVVVSADGPLLDQVAAHVDLTGPIIAALTEAWVVDLTSPPAA
jgi:hypothetical protein